MNYTFRSLLFFFAGMFLPVVPAYIFLGSIFPNLTRRGLLGNMFDLVLFVIILFLYFAVWVLTKKRSKIASYVALMGLAIFVAGTLIYSYF